MMHRAAFLDRDGTLIEDIGYPHRPEDLQILPGVIEALQRLQHLGFLLIIVTNQSGVARGYFSESDVVRFHRFMQDRFSEAGIHFARIYSCPYHPTEGIGIYRIDSELRKPRPGMIRLAATEFEIDLSRSVMIGDKASDIQAGQAAGCRTILLGESCEDTAGADAVMPNLIAAVDWLDSQSNRMVT